LPDAEKEELRTENAKLKARAEEAEKELESWKTMYAGTADHRTEFVFKGLRRAEAKVERLREGIRKFDKAKWPNINEWNELKALADTESREG